MAVFLTLSFKSADNEKKEYVVIAYNNNGKDISLSYSNGTYKMIECQKPQGYGDQTQILKLINEQEAHGYKLVNYNTAFMPNSSYYFNTIVLLSK